MVTVSSETGVRHTHTSLSIRSLIFLKKTQCHGLADPQVVCKMGVVLKPGTERNGTEPVADLEGVPWVPWNPPFCRQLEDQPAHGTVFSQEI